MIKRRYLSSILLLPTMLLFSCDDDTARPDDNSETLLHAGFQSNSLEADGFEIWSLPYYYEDGKIILMTDARAPWYGCMESLEQWDVAPGFLYKLTIKLEAEECGGGSAMNSQNYCGLKCNGDANAWIKTENCDYPTRTSFINEACGWDCESEEYCAGYETYVFEVTRNSVESYFIVDDVIMEFSECTQTCSGEIETIAISICMESFGANFYFAVDDIMLEKIAIDE